MNVQGAEEVGIELSDLIPDSDDPGRYGASSYVGVQQMFRVPLLVQNRRPTTDNMQSLNVPLSSSKFGRVVVRGGLLILMILFITSFALLSQSKSTKTKIDAEAQTSHQIQRPADPIGLDNWKELSDDELMFRQVGDDLVLTSLHEQEDAKPATPRVLPSDASISMSADGNRMVIVSQFPCCDRDVYGHVQAYEWSHEHWIRMGHESIRSDIWNTYYHGVRATISPDGTRIAISGPTTFGHKQNFGKDPMAGIIQVFEWDKQQNYWVEIGSPILEDWWCHRLGVPLSMSFSGERLVVGGPAAKRNSSEISSIRDWKRDCVQGTDFGHVRVFDWREDKMEWSHTSTLFEHNSTSTIMGNKYGHSVSIDGNGSRLVIGSGEYDDLVVRVFDRSNYDWHQVTPDIKAEDRFKYISRVLVEVSLDGNRIVITDASRGVNEGGHVRIYNFAKDVGQWKELGTVDADYDAPDCSVDDTDHGYFGSSMGMNMDGSRIVIPGATMSWGEYPDIGHVRAFDWSGTHWDQVGADINGNETEDFNFGAGLGMSSDGNRIVVAFSRKDEHRAYNYIRTLERNAD